MDNEENYNHRDKAKIGSFEVWCQMRQMPIDVENFKVSRRIYEYIWD